MVVLLHRCRTAATFPVSAFHVKLNKVEFIELLKPRALSWLEQLQAVAQINYQARTLGTDLP
jgi:hypothetical protein